MAGKRKIAFVLLLMAFVALDLWGHLGLYRSTWWVDVATHLLFGAWGALLCLHIGKKYGYGPLAAWGALMLVGVGWEFFEFAYDVLYAIPQGALVAQHGWNDTLKDLANNAIGAAIMLWIFRK